MSLCVSKISNVSYMNNAVAFRGKNLSEISNPITKNASKCTGEKLYNAIGILGWGLMILGLFGSIIFGVKASIVDKKQHDAREEMFKTSTDDIASQITYEDALNSVSNQ